MHEVGSIALQERMLAVDAETQSRCMSILYLVYYIDGFGMLCLSLGLSTIDDEFLL